MKRRNRAEIKNACQRADALIKGGTTRRDAFIEAGVSSNQYYAWRRRNEPTEKPRYEPIEIAAMPRHGQSYIVVFTNPADVADFMKRVGNE